MKPAKLPYNSANRLLMILNKTHLFGQERPELPIRDIFASAMQTKRDISAFYCAWAKLFCLIDQLKKDITQLPEAKYHIYKKALEEIVKNISKTDLSRSWETMSHEHFFLNNPNSNGFHILELCALDLGNKETEISPEKLRFFQTQIEKFLQEIQNIKSFNLKVFLEDQLLELKEKIESYQFSGSEGLKKSVEQSLGSLLLKNSEFEQTLEAEKQLIQHFLKLLKYILETLMPVNLRLPDKVLDSFNLQALKQSDSSI